MFTVGESDTYFSSIHTTLDPGTYYLKVSGSTSTVVCADYQVALDVYEYQVRTAGLGCSTNSFSLSWQGDAGFTYKIQYATSNLVGTQVWSTATNLAGRIGLNTWTDDGTTTVPAPAAARYRFYRVGTE